MPFKKRFLIRHLNNSILGRWVTASSLWCAEKSLKTSLTRWVSSIWTPSLRACHVLLQNQGPAKAQQRFQYHFRSTYIWHRKRGYTHKMDPITYFIAKDLVQWPISLHQTVHSCQPQAQEAVVDALHQHNLTDDEDWVPDVATEVTGHLGLILHIEAQRMLPAGPSRVWAQNLKQK